MPIKSCQEGPFMQLTLHTDYALRMLIYLKTMDAEGASVGRIAEAYGISSNHLSKVAQRMAALGWIVAARGRNGGLKLHDAANKLTVGDVVRRMETNRRIVECLGAGSTCPIEPACGLKSAIRKATDAFLGVLDQYRLDDLVRHPRQMRALLTISLPAGP